MLVDGDVTTIGPAGLVPPGDVAIPIPQRASTVHVGDDVATFADGRRLADGTVVVVDDEQAVVAVAAEDAAAVAQAVPGGAVVIGVIGAGAT